MWRAWKSCYRNKSAWPQLAGGTIAARLNTSRLSRNRTREDAVAIHADQKNGVRIHCIGCELECRRGRRERGCQHQGVWAAAWRSDVERAAELNIEELFPRSELVEIHDAAGVIPGGRSQLHLPDKVFLIAAYPAPNESKVPSQGGRGDRAGCLRQNCAVACDAAVRLLKNSLRWRNQIKNEGKSSGLGVRPCCGTATWTDSKAGTFS